MRLFIQCIEYSFSSLLVLSHCKYAIHGEEVSLMLSGVSLADVGDMLVMFIRIGLKLLLLNVLRN